MTTETLAHGNSTRSAPMAAGDTSWAHIWWHRTPSGVEMSRDLAVLDGSERARADRFRYERDRRRYVRRHSFMRRVLGRYLNTLARDIPIHTSRHGKPHIAGRADLSFNMSSTGERAVLVVSDGRPVGIDIERRRAIEDVLDLARDLFTAEEIELIQTTNAAAQDDAFLAFWTRKEALVKAIGGGLSIPLDSFTVLASGDKPVGVPCVASGEPPFSFTRLQSPAGVVGAIATASDRVLVRTMSHWSREN